MSAPVPPEQPYLLMRQDDTGNRYRVSRHATREEAQRAAEVFEARGHKQLYWVEGPA